MSEFRKYSITILLCILVVVFINTLSNTIFTPFKSKTIFIPPPKGIQYLSFGYNDTIADSLWLRWIQDSDACGRKKISRQEFEKNYSSYIQGEKKVDLKLGYDQSQREVCPYSWSFHMLDAIMTLAPKFRMPYAVGPVTLSVLTEDHQGAAELFDRGIKYFPRDWPILFRAAYLYLYELNDLERAADYMNRAADAGAPPWVKSLAARLYSKAGSVQMGIITLQQYYKTLKDSEYKEKVLKRIQELQKQLDN